jgi:hypothetical protein
MIVLIPLSGLVGTSDSLEVDVISLKEDTPSRE